MARNLSLSLLPMPVSMAKVCVPVRTMTELGRSAGWDVTGDRLQVAGYRLESIASGFGGLGCGRFSRPSGGVGLQIQLEMLKDLVVELGLVVDTGNRVGFAGIDVVVVGNAG